MKVNVTKISTPPPVESLKGFFMLPFKLLLNITTNPAI
jgi:hypothetical protein